MYIIFNYKIGQLQCGFKSLNDVNLQHGIIISENFNENFYYKNENFIIINNKYFIINNKKNLDKDYRIDVKSRILKKLLFIVFLIIFKLRNRKNKSEKCVVGIFLIIITLKFFSMGYFIYQNPLQKRPLLVWNYDTWKTYFKNSKIAHYISQNKFESISQEVPNIKGISSFRVLPLNSSVRSIEKFKAKIALPYKILISFKSDNSIILKNPVFNCENKKISIFEFDQSDDIFIFSNHNFIGNNYDFTIFMDDSMKNNICNEELTAKNPIEE